MSTLMFTWPADSGRFSWHSANLTSFPNFPRTFNSYRVGEIRRPHLSISQPHFAQVQPPQSACPRDFGCRACGIGEPQAGQFTCSELIPQRFFLTVPTATNRMPRRTTEATAMKTTFITRSGIIASIRMSNSTPTTIVTRMAFAYFMRRSRLIMLHHGKRFEP